jgi:hypothetical protein
MDSQKRVLVIQSRLVRRIPRPDALPVKMRGEVNMVVPRATVADVVKAGEQRLAKEDKTRERLAKGELGVEFYGLRAKLKELGVDYLEELPEEFRLATGAL